jgi:chemotaxis protein methyltransferase CheR
MANQIYSFFAEQILRESGIVYEEKDFFRLEGRLLTLMKEFKSSSLEDLFASFKARPSVFMRRLIDISTNNETYFFRDIKPFNLMSQDLVPASASKSKPVKIWSCGCSTGQEPASILMSIMETMPTYDFNIWATDISEQVLNKAKSGHYTQLEAQRGLDVNLLHKYFEKNPSGWTFKQQYLNKIKFDFFNLMKDAFPRGEFDVICCRNVLIYQNFENRKNIIRQLSASLKPHGTLVLGSGESLIGMDLDLRSVMINGVLVFQKTDSIKKVG